MIPGKQLTLYDQNISPLDNSMATPIAAKEVRNRKTQVMKPDLKIEENQDDLIAQDFY